VKTKACTVRLGKGVGLEEKRWGNAAKTTPVKVERVKQIEGVHSPKKKAKVQSQCLLEGKKKSVRARRGRAYNSSENSRAGKGGTWPCKKGKKAPRCNERY